MCDVGDIFCPANITKSHDQITKGVAQQFLSHGTLPMIMGGDHSIGYPCTAPSPSAWRARWGSSTWTGTWTRRKRTWTRSCTPARGSTPPTSRIARRRTWCSWGSAAGRCRAPGVKKGRERGTTILTVNDIEQHRDRQDHRDRAGGGVEGGQRRLLCRSTSTRWMRGSCPGRAGPSRAGSCPARRWPSCEGIAKEGIVAMEVVEVSPPYDISDITALLGARVMVDVLAVMVKNGRIGGRLKV